LADTACGLNNSPIAVKLDDGAGLEEPKEPSVIDAGERSFPITAE
jgi:hypothetical protein